MNIEWVYIVGMYDRNDSILLQNSGYNSISEGEWNMERVETNFVISHLLSINSDIFGGPWRGID